MADAEDLSRRANLIVGALNDGNFSLASQEFMTWGAEYLHRSDLLAPQLQVIRQMALAAHYLGQPEAARILEPMVFDRNESDDLFPVIKNMGPGTMVDVGAQWGSMLRSCVWCGWRVLAFEPDAENRNRLSGKYGGFRNLTIDPRGISDAVQSNVPFYHGQQSNVRSLHQIHDEAGMASSDTSIDVTTLSAALEEHDIGHVMYLKIDVEGAEHTWRGYTQEPSEIHPDAWGNVISFRVPGLAKRFADQATGTNMRRAKARRDG